MAFIYGDYRDFQPGGAYYEPEPGSQGPAAAPPPPPSVPNNADSNPYLTDDNYVGPDGTIYSNNQGHTPAPTTNTGTGGDSGGRGGAGSGDYGGFGKAWLASGGKTPSDLAAFVAAHPEYGAELFGSKMNKVRIGGRAFDAIYATSDPANARGSWDDITDGGGGGGTTQGDFHYPDFVPPSFDVPNFKAPDPFSYEAYQGPTSETFQADPGYDFAKKEGERSIQNAASAQGLLRTGGTLKDLMTFGQGLGAQQFGNVDARMFRNWSSNRGAAAEDYDRNWGNALTTYMTDYNREADEYNRALSTYGTNFGTAATSRGLNTDAANNRFGQLLNLYDIATRNLPRYSGSGSGSGSNDSALGFSY